MLFELDVDLADDGWSDVIADSEAVARRAVEAALAGGLPDAPFGKALSSVPARGVEVALCLADDATIRTLNRDYRGQDKATNVLAFAALDDDAPLPPAGPLPLGDVIIARETLVAEALRDGKDVKAHFTHLVVHGILHLLGYDHMTDDDAERMESLEIAILSGLDLPDPYCPL
ncbi:MAG: rRNA maturation RNase YbeY [Rhodospirillales bacterium]